MLELINVTKRFGGLTAVKSLSCEVQEGKIMGLIGPNGAGKTTAFNVISGFLRAEEGQVLFEGQRINRLRPDQLCHLGICRTFQIVQPFGNATVLDNVVVGALVRDGSVSKARRRAKEVLRLMGLEEQQSIAAKSLPIGNRKKLEVARALATKPKLLLLDEPMGGLNPTEVKQVMELLRKIAEQGITLFLIEHVMQAIMGISNHIVVLHHGEKIAEGPPAEMARDQRVVRAYLGEEYCIAGGR
jgi:branched-chain amino acid transport system ATP-binding protein